MRRPTIARQGKRQTFDLPLLAQMLRDEGLPIVSCSTDDLREIKEGWPGFICFCWQYPVWPADRREAERLARCASADHRLPGGGSAAKELYERDDFSGGEAA